MPKPSAAAATPTPTVPIGGSVAPLDAVTFRWTAPPGEELFDLRIAAAGEPDAPLAQLDALPTTETTLADMLPAGEMLWWVRRSGGAWSAPARFRAGTPADVEAARAVEAEAADAERAKARLNRQTGIVPLPETPPDPVWPHAKGDALDGAPALDWASVPGFEAPMRTDLALVDLTAPKPLAPLGGEVVDAAIVALRWNGVPGATRYEVELSPHAAFDADVLSLDAGRATEISLPGLVPAAGHRLLWRVRARTADGATAWSKYGRFYPAAEADVDQFRSGFDAAVVAQRRQHDHAARLRERELDLVPLHERPDAVTSSAAVGALIAMVLSGTVIALLAFLFVMTRT